MLTNLRHAALALALVACTAGTGSPSTSSGGLTQAPVVVGEVTSPTTGVKVTATIASVTLGEECGGGGGGFAPSESGDCAAPEDGGSSRGCSGTCQRSNMQLTFTSTAGSQSAQVDVVRVELIDVASGKLVDTLTSSKPQTWSGGNYAAWDELVKPASTLQTSYDLTAPAWSKISTDSSLKAYATKYKLHVTLTIDGTQVTLESTELTREPAVAT